MRPQAPAYVKLARKLFQDPFWTERRPFSRFEAWVDLIQRAQWRDRVFESQKYGRIELKRGDVIVSRRRFAKHWNRPEAWVQRFLKSIQQMDRVSIQQVIRAGTVYRIVNYDAYQRNLLGVDPVSDPVIDPQSGTSTRQYLPKAVKDSDPALKLTTVSESSSNLEPPKTSAVPETTSRGGSLDRLPKEIVDLCYTEWGQRFGAVNYPQLRKALLGAVDVGIPTDHLHGAVKVYAERYEAFSERDRQFNRPSPDKFAVEIARWARLGQMPYNTLEGFLTERGELATTPNKTKGAA